MNAIKNSTTMKKANTQLAFTQTDQNRKSFFIKATIITLSLASLTACGGGGGEEMAGTASNVSLATVTTGYTPKPSTPSVATPVVPGSQPAGSPAVGAPVTDIRLQNNGAAQTNVPFTFGQVIAAGEMSATEGMLGKLADGTLIRLQTNIKATHADGSVRHVIVSGVLPSLAAGETKTITLLKSSASEKSTATLQTLAASGLTGKVSITENNVLYTATLADAINAGKSVNWLSGTVANEWILEVPLKNASGASHPLLTARFDVRWYSALPKKARVDVIVENTKIWTAARNITYDVNVDVGGRSVYAKTGLSHYHRARWRQTAWWDAATEPTIHYQHNVAYLIASKAVSNYDQSVVPSENSLAELGKQLLSGGTGPMTIGPLVPYMPMAGGRGDIGPLPAFSVTYLLSQDKRAKDLMMAAADGSGTWSMHFRDEKTGYPLRTDNETTKNVSTHPNWKNNPFPGCADSNACTTPFSHDDAHQPSLAYLPYLVTGDHYYLEELQFWAAVNPLGTHPEVSGYGQGLVRYQQLRGQAWSLRTLGQVAYITPDADPMKAYFTKQLDNNLNYYHTTYVVGNPNKLGVYDGSGVHAFSVSASAPWQDDFFTWSFGYLNELGFTKAAPILRWKAKYSIGRMTAPGFCWIGGATYSLKFREDANTPLYSSFAELYAANYGGNSIVNDDGETISDPQGSKFIDQPCGSQAQSDWITRANRKNWSWTAGRMFGWSDSLVGTPAQMQPALAVAATSGVENGTLAWTTFMGRTMKPDYSKSPQWAIIPRK